jgi:hypothetical protein
MPKYMLLLYAPEVDEAEQADREAELPVWNEVIESLRDAGQFVSTGRLHPAARATTVRARGEDAELTDGPFAVTKEVLGGYLLLDCSDLDEALKAAARLPIARYGSVEVRPLVDMPSMPSS